MRKNHPALALILLTAFVAGCGKGTEHAAKQHAAAAAKDGKAGAPEKSVTLTAPQKQFLTIEAVGTAQSGEALLLPGRVTFRPQAQSSVGATVAGRVVAQLVRAGEVVKAGTPVIIIESVDASAARTN